MQSVSNGKATRLALVAALVAALCQESAVTAPKAQSSEPPQRLEAELAVRNAAFEITLAGLMGDAAAFARHATARTLGVYDLVYELSCENPKVRDQFQRAGIHTGRDYLRVSLQQNARSNATIRASAEAIAKENSSAPLKFISSTEANLTTKNGIWRVVWEGDQWKVDRSESLKSGFLKMPTLSPEARARLERF